MCVMIGFLFRLLELTTEREAEGHNTGVSKSAEGLTGLKILMRNVGDERLASEPFIIMPTMYIDGQEVNNQIKRVCNFIK